MDQDSNMSHQSKGPQFDLPFQPINGGQQQKKNNRAKIIVIVLAAMLFAGGIGYAAALQSKISKNDTAEKKQEAAVTLPDISTTEPVERLIYQVGNELYAYDAKAKKMDLLTAKLPAEAEVEDVYVHSKGWALYYGIHKSEVTEYWYMANDGSPIRVAAIDGYARTVADAKNQRLVYTVAWSMEKDATEDDKKVKTYLVSGTKSEMIWQSGTEYVEGDFMSPSYAVVDMTDDGSRVLFNTTKFYGDGVGAVDAYELDIATKTPRLVYRANSAGNIRYADSDNAFVVDESNTYGMVDQIAPLTINVKRITDAASTGDYIARITSPTKGQIGISPDAKLSYKFTESSELEGLYAITGAAVNARQKLTVAGWPAGFSIYELGKQSGGCYGVKLSKYDSNMESIYDLGTICIEGTKATYVSLKSGAMNQQNLLQTRIITTRY